MFKMEMQWKEFSVDLRAVEAHMRSSFESYAGNQAAGSLELWFNEELSQEDQSAVIAYWDDIHDDSAEATSYQSAADLAAEVAAKKASGKAKLAALGLSEDEIAALVG